MDPTDDSLAYSGIAILLIFLMAIVISVIKYSCIDTDIPNKDGALLEDPVSEV